MATTFIPIPFASHLVDTIASPYASIEARVVHVKTGEVIIPFANKKFPKIKPIDLNKIVVESSIREIINIWSEESVNSLFADPGEKVKPESNFSLLLW